MTPGEFEALRKSVMEIAERLAEQKTPAWSGALLVIVVELIATLRHKDIIDMADVERMLASLGMMSADTSATAPEHSKCLAEAVLYLQHGLVEEADKAN